MTDINEVLNDKNYKKVLDFGFVGVVFSPISFTKF
jgi:hypothetical protein